MFSVGVLAFLFVEVLVHGVEIVEGHVEELDEGEGQLSARLPAGRCPRRRVHGRQRGPGAGRAPDAPPKPPPIAGGATDAMTVEQAEIAGSTRICSAQALRTGMTIAAAIGLHNFAEGLAIGVSASTGEIGLATVLIIGFAVHNATEGFGIVGPLGDVRPELELARPRRPGRRRPRLPRRDGRLQRHLRAARAALLRASRPERSST